MCSVKGWDNQALFLWYWYDILTVTVNSERYVAMLHDFYIPYLRGNEWDIRHVRFQKDVATTHTARVSMNVIRETFAGRLISRNGDILGHPAQLKLALATSSLLSEVQIVQSQSTRYYGIKRGHTTWNGAILVTMLTNVTRNFNDRLQECVNIEERHLARIMSIISCCLYYQ